MHLLGLLLLLLLPLAGLLALAWALRRRERAREAFERPAREAAERLTRALDGRLLEGDVLRVEAEREGRRVACVVAAPSLLLTLEVECRAPLREVEVSLHRVGGRELADYAGVTLLLAGEEGLEALWGGGPSPEGVLPKLPADLRASILAIDATHLSFLGGRIALIGCEAPSSEAELPLFLERLDRALTLARALEAGA